MKKNNAANSIVLPILVIIIIGMAFFGYIEHNLLETKLADREQFIDSLEKKNSTERRFYQSKLDSIAVLSSDTTYQINNKNVSMATIIKSANAWYIEKEKLKFELQNCQALQKAYQSNFEHVGELYKKEVGRGNDNAKNANENARIANAWIKNYKDVTTKYNPDKYRELEFFYKTVKEQFGLDYTVENQGDSTRILRFKPSSKLDSALGYFEAIKAGRIRTNITINEQPKTKKQHQ